MTAKKTAPASVIPATKLALYENLVATDPSIERKGVTVPYTSISGKMFSFLSPSGDLRLRLPPDEREAFMKKYRTTAVVTHGVEMEDWVAVPAALLTRTAELQPYLARSRAYAETLGTKSPRTAAKGRR